METKTCPDCGCTTTPNNYKRHIGSKQCLLNQQNEKSTKIDDSWLLENGKYQCPHCDKEYSKNGIGTHIWRTHGEGQNWTANIDGYKDGTRKGTNGFIKGTQVEHSDETKKKISEKATGREHTIETKNKLSEYAKKNKLGGVRQSMKITYKGTTLGSTYELAVVKDLELNNIVWTTCDRIKYKSSDGKERTYTPDIYLPDFNIYLDPKNDFLIENINPRLGFKDIDKIKWVCEQNNIRVFVLNKNQLNWDYIKDLI